MPIGACNFGTSADRNVGKSRLCDHPRLYGNKGLCDRLRSAICDPRSSAIIWKPAFSVDVQRFMCINKGVRGDDLQFNSYAYAAFGKLEDDFAFPKYLGLDQQTVMVNNEN